VSVGRIIPAFTDADGRQWQPVITVGFLRQFRNLVNFDLKDLLDEKAARVQELFADQEKFVACVWCLVERAARKAGVTPEQFGMAFDGTTLETAGQAFLEAVLLFTQKKGVAEATSGGLRSVWEEQAAALGGAVERALDKAFSSTAD